MGCWRQKSSWRGRVACFEARCNLFFCLMWKQGSIFQTHHTTYSILPHSRRFWHKISKPTTPRPSHCIHKTQLRSHSRQNGKPLQQNNTRLALRQRVSRPLNARLCQKTTHQIQSSATQKTCQHTMGTIPRNIQQHNSEHSTAR